MLLPDIIGVVSLQKSEEKTEPQETGSGQMPHF
jgi:hypothetical protein